MDNNLFFSRKFPANIFMLQPESWDCVEKAIAALKAGHVVLLNLERVPTDMAQRMTDFASGCISAISGHQVAIGHDVYLFCPPNVTVSLKGVDQTASQWVVPQPVQPSSPAINLTKLASH
jgi:FtsZ-interacting cell division protein YlmF